MPSPIVEHTVPWPAADAARYTAAGYWAGIPLGTLLRTVADQLPDALAPGDRIVVQLQNGWEFPVLLLACLRAGIVPVMALPAHRRAELSYLAIHAEASAIAVPGRVRDFDHQAMARDLGPEVQAATRGPWHVLVAGGAADGDSVDLRALCATGTDPAADRTRLDSLAPRSRDVAVFLLSGGTTGLPKLI